MVLRRDDAVLFLIYEILNYIKLIDKINTKSNVFINFATNFKTNNKIKKRKEHYESTFVIQ